MKHPIKIQSFDSEIIFQQEQSQQKVHPSSSFLNQVFEKQLEEESQTGLKRQPKNFQKTKQIERNIRIQNVSHRRKNSKSGKWSGANRLNYYKATLRFSIEHPYYKISWGFWKPEKFYPRMIEQINRNECYYKKDVIQTKSFDQRQRKQFYQTDQPIDMIEIAMKKLRQRQYEDEQSKQILAAYENKLKEKSQHMQLLDKLMVSLQQEIYDIQDFHCQVMGFSKPMRAEFTSSIFYS